MKNKYNPHEDFYTLEDGYPNLSDHGWDQEPDWIPPVEYEDNEYSPEDYYIKDEGC